MEQAKRKGNSTRRRSKRVRKAKEVTADPPGGNETAKIWDLFEIRTSELELNLRYFLPGTTGLGVFLKTGQACTFEPLP
jgi:hypothetical protein